MDHFYIGWQDDMPDGFSAFLKKRILFLLFLLPVLALSLVLFQHYFKKGVFQIGTITEITGIYVSDPVPMLLDVTLDEDSISSDVLLVGYGKFGAEGIMRDIEARSGSLDHKKVTFVGTLITGGDKDVLELTHKGESFIAADSDTNTLPPSVLIDSNIKLFGEIIDPKCYFGAMKPGEGKIHKSCAIRCISGGIPPVYRSVVSDSYEYFILLDQNGEPFGDQVLPFVGESIVLHGDIYDQGKWKVLHADLSTFQNIH